VLTNLLEEHKQWDKEIRYVGIGSQSANKDACKPLNRIGITRSTIL
jgi:hypothetical protein